MLARFRTPAIAQLLVILVVLGAMTPFWGWVDGICRNPCAASLSHYELAWALADGPVGLTKFGFLFLFVFCGFHAARRRGSYWALPWTLVAALAASSILTWGIRQYSWSDRCLGCQQWQRIATRCRNAEDCVSASEIWPTCFQRCTGAACKTDTPVCDAYSRDLPEFYFARSCAEPERICAEPGKIECLSGRCRAFSSALDTVDQL